MQYSHSDSNDSDDKSIDIYPDGSIAKQNSYGGGAADDLQKGHIFCTR